MSSEQISTIAIDPFIREFTFQIIKTIGLKKYYRRERMIVHSDLVPRFSENVVKASMGQKLIPPRQLPMLRTENVPEEMKILVEPIPEKNILPPVRRIVPQKVVPPRIVQRQKFMAPQKQELIKKPESFEEAMQVSSYGKLDPLLRDPSVHQIECPGAGKLVSVIRMGQRQITKIVLTASEIKQIIENVSNAAHIPLLNGVFRAVVDDFSISAVISDMIGSRFVMKKLIPGIPPGRYS